MDMNELIQSIKQHSDFDRVGMILCHNGVVRATSREGRKVTGLKLTVDHEKLRQVIEKHKKRPGILDIRIQIVENKRLAVGDDVMFLVVAGDIRDNVVPALHDTLNEIKTTVTRKEQFFAD